MFYYIVTNNGSINLTCSVWKHAFISLCRFQPVVFAPVLKVLLRAWWLQFPMLIKPGSSSGTLLLIKHSKNFQFTLGQFINICFKFFMLSVDVPSSILWSKSVVETLNPIMNLYILCLSIPVTNDNIHLVWLCNRVKTFTKWYYETIR